MPKDYFPPSLFVWSGGIACTSSLQRSRMGRPKFKKGLGLREELYQATIVEEGHHSDPKGDMNQTKNEYEDD
jgi:hypothetical protein